MGFGHKKAVIEGIKEDIGILKHYQACGPAEHAKEKYIDTKNAQTLEHWLRNCLGLRNISQEVTIMPRSVPSSTLPLNMLSVWLLCWTRISYTRLLFLSSSERTKG